MPIRKVGIGNGRCRWMLAGGCERIYEQEVLFPGFDAPQSVRRELGTWMKGRTANCAVTTWGIQAQQSNRSIRVGVFVVGSQDVGWSCGRWWRAGVPRGTYGYDMYSNIVQRRGPLTTGCSGGLEGVREAMTWPLGAEGARYLARYDVRIRSRLWQGPRNGL